MASPLSAFPRFFPRRRRYERYRRTNGRRDLRDDAGTVVISVRGTLSVSVRDGSLWTAVARTTVTSASGRKTHGRASRTAVTGEKPSWPTHKYARPAFGAISAQSPVRRPSTINDEHPNTRFTDRPTDAMWTNVLCLMAAALVAPSCQRAPVSTRSWFVRTNA